MVKKKKVVIAISDLLLEEVDEAYRAQALAALEDAEAFAREVAADPLAAHEPSTLEKIRATHEYGSWDDRLIDVVTS